MRHKTGATNGLLLFGVVTAAALAGLTWMLVRLDQPRDQGDSARDLFMYCAAGIRVPVEEVVAEYESRYGVSVQLQFGGSNTLLNQLEISHTGDLYLAADDSYLSLAREKGLANEILPLAWMKPVIAVRRGNPKGIARVSDLLRPDVRVAVANPDAAAVGKKVRKLLKRSGHWAELERAVTERGVFKPTVNDVANDIKLESVDAGIVWDATAAQYDELEAVETPELDAGQASVGVTVLESTADATAALRFARFLAARDEGLKAFGRHKFKIVDGDKWDEAPALTFFSGSVNRQALDPVLREFERREGVLINTVYNGCGILTATMRTMERNRESGFPDCYMACDVYYLKTVSDWFDEGVQVSDTPIVIVVAKGNPKNIRTLSDLIRPGVRVALGQPEQCTIGVLSKRLLDDAGIYEQLAANNLVTQTATSALLVPNVTTGAADAVLAYRTDTIAEQHRLDIVPIASPLAQAVQPYSIALSSEYKHMGQRLFERIAQSKSNFENAGFHWRLDANVAGSHETTGDQ